MKIKRILLRKIIYIFLATGVLFTFLGQTNPNEIALPLLMIPFFITGYILYGATSLIVSSTSSSKLVRRIFPISVTLLGLTILILQSLHQLTWKDTFLVFGLAALFLGYVRRIDFFN